MPRIRSKINIEQVHRAKPDLDRRCPIHNILMKFNFDTQIFFCPKRNCRQFKKVNLIEDRKANESISGSMETSSREIEG